MEDPNLHLSVFSKVLFLKAQWSFNRCHSTLTISFTLKDKAQTWLHLLPLRTISTWDELTKDFLAKFFLSSNTVSLRNQIITLTQRENKSLYEAWE